MTLDSLSDVLQKIAAGGVGSGYGAAAVAHHLFNTPGAVRMVARFCGSLVATRQPGRGADLVRAIRRDLIAQLPGERRGKAIAACCLFELRILRARAALGIGGQAHSGTWGAL